MPVYVNPDICNGCGNSAQPPCVRMCPGDLIVKDRGTNKAYLKYKEDCWDCLPCVKACPEEAIEFKLSYQLGFQKAKLIPHINGKRDKITWEAIDNHGNVEEFVIPTKLLPVALDEKIEGTTAVDYSI